MTGPESQGLPNTAEEAQARVDAVYKQFEEAFLSSEPGSPAYYAMADSVALSSVSSSIQVESYMSRTHRDRLIAREAQVGETIRNRMLDPQLEGYGWELEQVAEGFISPAVSAEFQLDNAAQGQIRVISSPETQARYTYRVSAKMQDIITNARSKKTTSGQAGTDLTSEEA